MAAERRRRIGHLSLVVLLFAFIAAVIATNTLLGGIRLDLTENKLYTLAPGTRSLLGSIEEPVNLYFFFSERAASDLPGLRTFATRVSEMLDEFVAAADGKIVLQTLDPQPFSEEEDRATQFGLQPIGVGDQGDDIYFGLAGTNSVGDQGIIAAFRSDREAFLEYDLATLVYSLAHPNKVVVGLLAGIQLGGGFNVQTQQPTQPWVITQQARQLFEVRTLPQSVERIDDDIDVLWIVHPAGFDDKTLYAIDQFVLRGGRALVFVDPFAEIASAGAGPGAFGAQTGSSLDRLFEAWGIDFSSAEVVVDLARGLNLSGGLRPVRHIGLLGLDMASMDQQDVVTSGLNSVNIGTAGHFTKREGSEIRFTPLMTSSTEAATMPATRFQFLADPEELLDDFAPTGKSYVLAARLEGPVHTAFPDGPPGGGESDSKADAAGDAATTDAAAESDSDAAGDDAADATAAEGSATAEEDSTSKPAHLTSIDNANVIVVGDVDMLTDRMWVSVQNFLGQRLLTSFANNGDFLINALDNLSGSEELIGLRSRATYSRPFTKVQELRRRADARFRQTEQRLEAELAETERKLGELQAARDDKSSLLMSPEQQAEIQRFLNEQVRIRQELRAVRRELDRSIENLGTTLKVLNMGLIPLLLTIGVLGYTFAKKRKVKRS
ncbi:MAG TPA: Gldg family protein [Gammaproteobacteria bacterium]